jgi:outer membrane protein W
VHTLQRLSGFLAALVAVIPVAARSAHATESAAVSEAGVDRMIDLNKKAYADIQDQHFQAAKYRLSEALVISETAGLEGDEMTARTYVHLAVVYLTGLKDREEAIQQFMLALHINPNITITPGLESPALRSAYLQAREQLDLPPNPDTTAPLLPQAASAPAPDAATIKMVASAKLPGGESNDAAEMNEPDPPARVPSPLYCHLPFDTPPEQDVVVRCLTQKQQRKSEAIFHYRPQGAEEEYVGLPMVRSPKGWLMAVVPGRAIRGKALSYYVKADVPGQPAALYLGHPEAPNALIIRTLPDVDGADDATDEPDTVTGMAKAHSPEVGEGVRPSRLRAPGSVWVAVAGGTGTAYHGRETVDSNAKVPGTSTPVTVQSGFSAASLFQLEPEIGYQLSKRLSISILGRYQVAPKDASKYVPGAGEHAIPTTALSGFVRGQFAFASKGGFQPYASGGAGLGTSFLAVVNKRCGTTTCSLDHSDTLHGGAVALTAGVGAIYHVSPSVGVFVDIKEIATLSKFLALTEVNVGLAFAHKLKGADGQKQAHSTGDVSWR